LPGLSIKTVMHLCCGGQTKQLFVPLGESLCRQMVEKIDPEVGRRIYPQRLAIAEPVFANILINKP
jgi:hypothetical protein